MINENIVIFGGVGFIGTNLARRLLDKDNKVLCFDNLSTSGISNTKLFNSNSNYKFVKADIVTAFEDITIYREVDKFFGKGFPYDGTITIDEIYNLACPDSSPKYQIDPLHTLDTCIAVKDICCMAQFYKAKMLHASTSEVYGDPIVHPQVETYRGNVNTIGPRSCYDEGKRVAETYCYEWRKKGVDIKLMRIFNTYGPYMNPEDGRVVSNFIMQALNNQDITIYGDGMQTRSFQYIDDLLDAMEHLMNSDEAGPFNFGNPDEFTINQLVTEIKKLLPNSTSKITFNDLPVDDPTQRKPNIAKAKETFGLEPKIKLSEGLKLTIDYFKTHYLY